jgi:hypothetical protein
MERAEIATPARCGPVDVRSLADCGPSPQWPAGATGLPASPRQPSSVPEGWKRPARTAPIGEFRYCGAASGGLRHGRCWVSARYRRPRFGALAGLDSDGRPSSVVVHRRNSGTGVLNWANSRGQLSQNGCTAAQLQRGGCSIPINGKPKTRCLAEYRMASLRRTYPTGFSGDCCQDRGNTSGTIGQRVAAIVYNSPTAQESQLLSLATAQ